MRSPLLRRIAWKTIAGAALLVSVISMTPAAIAQSLYMIDSRGPAVVEIQRRLGIAEDGIYGQQTANAVADFQAANGLQIDGVAGVETLRALGLGYLIGDSGFPGTSVPFNPVNPNPGSPSAGSFPYVVAVPGSDLALLNQVRRFVPDAYVDRSRRGSFVRAGSFARRRDAEQWARNLRQRDFDARVTYRP